MMSPMSPVIALGFGSGREVLQEVPRSSSASRSSSRRAAAWSSRKRPSYTTEPILYGPLLRLKTYIVPNPPLRLSSCDFVLCLVAGSLSGEGGGCLLAPTRILLLPLPLS